MINFLSYDTAVVSIIMEIVGKNFLFSIAFWLLVSWHEKMRIVRELYLH